MSSYLEAFFYRRKMAPQLTPDQKARELEKNLQEQRQKLIDYKKYFGEPHGRTVMLDLMNKFNIMTPLPKSGDPLELARAEGNREVVLYLLRCANTNIEQLDKIMRGEFI